MSTRTKNSGSVAPKERINISYRPAVGSAKEGVELPFKLLVLGDFTQNQDDSTIEDRKLININNYNFDDVIKKPKFNCRVFSRKQDVCRWWLN